MNKKNKIRDPDGWTRENNPRPAPPYLRLYPDRKGEHWSDYMEHYGHGKYICHACLKRAEEDNGNCIDGGDYFQCVRSGERAKRRKMLEEKSKRTIQSRLI